MIPLHRLQPLICDPYRISTVYSYWKNQKGSKGAKNENAVFELYTIDNSSHSKFTVFAGLEEFLKGLRNFHFEDDGIVWLNFNKSQV